ncbi:NAD-dependent protein deacetylase Sirt2-like [Drosophila guanche]|uniref:NAD-dependent protein deacetylase Sirt2-like n=1 Tax=Drosophila guanche TaxID=7266 RepID=UPI0014722F4F|nr:NAD-dependent protein deacetylase Sirt2-like [Drosophila guanche]
MEYGIAWMKEKIFADRLPKCTACKKIVKPDIVFLGEDLPEKFHKSLDGDFKECELLTIMGTSLELHPFVALAHLPPGWMTKMTTVCGSIRLVLGSQDRK